MLKFIVKYGVIAGLVVGSILFGMTVSLRDNMPHGALGMAIGYATMLLALSAVFVGVKAYRDGALGGVIRFLPAFGMGLGISLVAAIFYVLAWEAALAVTDMDFIAAYTTSTLAQMRADGASAAEIAETTAQMGKYAEIYKNPLARMAMTSIEILPVGLLVSLVSAALLCRPSFMPARPAAA
jgi:hypothetical protein